MCMFRVVCVLLFCECVSWCLCLRLCVMCIVVFIRVGYYGWCVCVYDVVCVCEFS